jgi:hypothetical protein
MDRNQEILPLLRTIAKNETALRLVSLYKGLPIIYDAAIVSIEQSTIHLRCNKYQLACLFLQHETYMVGDEIQGTIHADVTGLIPARDEAILANLQYVEKPYILRDQVRVEPQEPIRITAQLKGSLATIDVLLADISLNGLGVYLDRDLFHPKIWMTGAELSVSVPLPEQNQQRGPAVTSTLRPTTDLTTRFSSNGIRGLGFLAEEHTPQRRTSAQPAAPGIPGRIVARGVIVNMRPELAHSRYRLGVRLIHESSARILISQFISQRQSEIIREFKTIYDSLIRFDKVKTGS